MRKMSERRYGEYLKYCLPKQWVAEEEGDMLVLYHPRGNGAMVLSFFSLFEAEQPLDKRVSIFAKKFIDGNGIITEDPLLLFEKDGKTVLQGEGMADDKAYVKFWVVAKYPKLILATYDSEKKNKEERVCDAVIDSFRFSFR